MFFTNGGTEHEACENRKGDEVEIDVRHPEVRGVSRDGVEAYVFNDAREGADGDSDHGGYTRPEIARWMAFESFNDDGDDSPCKLEKFSPPCEGCGCAEFLEAGRWFRCIYAFVGIGASLLVEEFLRTECCIDDEENEDYFH